MLGSDAAESTQIIANRELREALALIKKHITGENTQQNHDLYLVMQLVVDASRRVGLLQDPDSPPKSEYATADETALDLNAGRSGRGLTGDDDPRNPNPS
jgi:hypothetical protein